MRPKYVEYEIEFYRDKTFVIEGAVFYDSCSFTYIASIEIVQADGHYRIELFCREYKDLSYAKKAIHTNYKSKITKIYRRIKDAKDKQD